LINLLDAHRISPQRARAVVVDDRVQPYGIVLAQRQWLVGVDLQPSGLQLGQVEQIIDHAQHHQRGSVDVVKVAAVNLGRQVGTSEPVEAQDGVERCAQLVADAREERFALARS
jgi:hypothetical protein